MQQRPLFYKFSDYGLIQVSGAGAKKLLQGQLTCDMEKISTNHPSLAAHCHPQGRVISLFYVFSHADYYLLLLPNKMIDITINALKKYAPFYKVDITDASDALMCMGYEGDRPLHDMQDYAVITLPSSSRIICVGRRELIEPLLKNASSLLSDEAWKLRDITEGIPSIYPETSGVFLPHDLNLHQLQAIDFEKGCYTGQEIIARMHYKGKLKNHLYLANIITSSPPLPGQDIFAWRNQQAEVHGTIVDACHEKNHSYRTLILVDEAHAKNQTLFLDRTIPFDATNDYFFVINEHSL